jgi:sortase (surface protein transpeptidase)
MARTWPTVVVPVHVPARLLGEVVLTVMLAAALTFTGRDGVPPEKFVYPDGPVSSLPVIDDLQVPGNNLSGMLPVVEPAPPPQPKVPTAAPVQLLIPSLDVHRAVEKVGVDQFGVMNLPSNAWNAGWYRGGPVPGAPGDAVIEGHAGYPGKPMIFGKLVTLKPGDRIIVVLGDGTKRLFLVVSTSRVPVGAAPKGFAEPYGVPRLTLITCTGHFDKASYSYSERLVVETRYAGLI